MMQRRRWSDLTPRQRIGTVLLGAIQLALFGAAELDILRRPASEIRGRKALWAGLSFINFFGPLAYFAFGRKRE